jgi:hypothetical protein
MSYSIIITGDTAETGEATESAADTATEFDAVVTAAKVFVSTLAEVTDAEITGDDGKPVSLMPAPPVSDELRTVLADLDTAVAAVDTKKPTKDQLDAVDAAAKAVDAAAQRALDELKAAIDATPNPTAAVPFVPSPTGATPAVPDPQANPAEAAAHAASTVAL